MKNELPDGWNLVKLKDITECLDNKRVPLNGEERLKIQGHFPYYGANGQLDGINQYIFDEELLLVAEDGGSWGKKQTCAYIIRGKSWVNNHAHVLRMKKDVEISFLMHCLNESDLRKYITGTTRGKLNRANMDKIEIPLPSLKTQQEIVAILEKAEETKKIRAQADELTQQLLQSVFLEMFGDPVTNPNGWKTKKLKDLAEIVSGVTKGRKLAGKTTVFVPYLRVANVQDGYLDLTEIKQIEVLPSDVDKFQLIDGDVLLTEGGDPDKLGRGAVWHSEIETCIHQNHIFRVRVNQEYLVPEYLSMLTGSSYGKRYFLKSAKQTTGIASINSTQLKNFPTQLPPLELQYHFAEIVNQLEKTKYLQQQSSQEIDTLFNALTQKAFNGELVAE